MIFNLLLVSFFCSYCWRVKQTFQSPPDGSRWTPIFQVHSAPAIVFFCSTIFIPNMLAYILGPGQFLPVLSMWLILPDPSHLDWDVTSSSLLWTLPAPVPPSAEQLCVSSSSPQSTCGIGLSWLIDFSLPQIPGTEGARAGAESVSNHPPH